MSDFGLDSLIVHSYELVPPDPLGSHPLRRGVYLTRVHGRDIVRWAIRHGEGAGSDVFTRDGEWEWEPQPSSRDDAFFARCRFATADEGLACWLVKR